MGNNSEVIYSWDFSTEKNRGQLWYIIALSIVIGLVIWGFITKQYGMSFLIILASGVYFFLENNSEDRVSVSINELGISVGTTFYDYSKIHSYTFLYDRDIASTCRLQLTQGIKILDLKVDNDIVAELKQILPNYLEENPNGELSFSDKLIKWTKL